MTESRRDIEQSAEVADRPELDLTRPGPSPMLLDAAMHKINTEYRAALERLRDL